ncbi:MAG: SafA/ExsA family spore coat assembly protein [Oscillibacter sp.]
MQLSAMRYKNYTWPHNPETYSVTYRRRVAVQKIPFGSCCMQDLGASYRVMRGEGSFAGEGAYDEFRRLARVFTQSGPGLLVHPVWKTAGAYFVSLELAEEPLPDYVRYTFEFWEDCGDAGALRWVGGGAQDGGESGTAESGDTHRGDVYIVKKGDTLWGIAKRYGVTLAALIAANPQIKNPNLVYPGNRVQLP